MSQIPKSHEIYRHFKGNLYQVLELAEHSETGEQLVIYQALYGDFKIYARPLFSFIEKLDIDKYPDANQTFRFELQVQEAESPQNEVKDDAPQNEVEDDASQKDAEDNAEEVLEVTKEENNDAEAQEYQIDDQVMEFLDANTYEERLNILVGLRHRITDDMITTMAMACDIEVSEGSLEERFLSLKNCLLTKEKYECERPR